MNFSKDVYNISKYHKLLENSRVELFNKIIELKKQFPFYFRNFDSNCIINHATIVKQKDKDTMFNIEIFDGNGSIFYIMLPINITKLKTIEYSYIRNAFLSEKNDDEFIKLVRYHHQTLKNMYSRKFKSDKELRRVIKEGIERIKKNGRHF